MKKFKGQWALVTGASSGIGREYVRQLAALGIHVIAIARRHNLLIDLAHEVREKYGTEVETVSIDLTDPVDVQNFLNHSFFSEKQMTFFINNAGIGFYEPFCDSSWKDHEQVIHLNILTFTQLTYYVIEHMKKHGLPSFITHVASVAAYQSVKNFSVYSASKAYVRIFSQTLSFELKKTNIHILCLCPGGTVTGFLEQAGQHLKPEGKKTMMTPTQVVEKGLKALFEKKTVYIPGFLNQVACFLPRFLPYYWGLFLAEKSMNYAISRVPSLKKKGEKIKE